jgi:hypothetical protein
MLDAHERAFRGGNKSALLAAVAECADAGLTMPEWLASAYLRAYRSVRNYEAKSWDDVFGSAHRKGTNLTARRRRHEKSVKVWLAVESARRRGPVDDALFAAVGRELGIGPTLTKEYYSDRKRLLRTVRRRTSGPW